MTFTAESLGPYQFGWDILTMGELSALHWQAMLAMGLQPSPPEPMDAEPVPYQDWTADGSASGSWTSESSPAGTWTVQS